MRGAAWRKVGCEGGWAGVMEQRMNMSNRDWIFIRLLTALASFPAGLLMMVSSSSSRDARSSRPECPLTGTGRVCSIRSLGFNVVIVPAGPPSRPRTDRTGPRTSPWSRPRHFRPSSRKPQEPGAHARGPRGGLIQILAPKCIDGAGNGAGCRPGPSITRDGSIGVASSHARIKPCCSRGQ